MIIKVGNIVGGGQSQGGNTYLSEGISPTLLSGMSHGNVMPFIVEVKQMENIDVSAVNPMDDGTCRTIKNQYHKTGVSNMLVQGTFGASGAAEIIRIGNASDGNTQSRSVYDSQGLCPTLMSGMDYGNTVPYTVDVRQATKEGVIPCEIPGIADLNYPDSQTRRGRVQMGGQICPTLTTESIPSVLEPWVWEIDGTKYLIRIRKLTPRECWRLMGFAKRRDDGTWDDTPFEAAEKVNSNTQLYKQAGNSIVVDVLEAIFKEMM